MRDVLPTLEQWSRDGIRAALGTVISVERSSPRGPGAVMAVNEHGEIAGSVTGGCVEPDVVLTAEEVLAGSGAQVKTYGYSDDDAYEVGLPCGGSIRILVDLMDPDVILRLAKAVRTESPLAVVTDIAGSRIGEREVVDATTGDPDVLELVSAGESGTVGDGDAERFVLTVAARPRMYVFGAIDHASALTTVGKFLGYKVIVCDARGSFVTPQRFPDADELHVKWPHTLIEDAHIDERTAICVLTHDAKFDVPALIAALKTPAGYIGAMGSRRTTERRVARLREEGVTDDELARIHAPIGLSIRSKTPQEVAVAIGAEIIQTMRTRVATAAGNAR